MLLSKRNLTDHVASDDATRPQLAVLHVTPAGVISTDGHRMLCTPLPADVAADDFPGSTVGETFDASAELADGEAIDIPTSALKRVIGTIPSRPKYPALGAVALDAAATRANGHVYLGTSDLETGTLHRVKRTDTTFPDYARVTPRPERMVLEIGLNAEYLAELARLVADRGAGERAIKLQVYLPADNGDPADVSDERVAELRKLLEPASCCPVRLEAAGDRPAWGLCMPMRV